MSSTALLNPWAARVAFATFGSVAGGTSGLLFRDLADFSHWIHKPNRDHVMQTFFHRHKVSQLFGISTLIHTTLMAVSTSSSSLVKPQGQAAGATTKSFHLLFGSSSRRMQRLGTAMWAAGTVGSVTAWFLGYINPELMMRPRNHNALYVSAHQAVDTLGLDPHQWCVVTEQQRSSSNKNDNSTFIPYCFPDAQIMRPHIARLPGNRQPPAVILPIVP